MLYLYLFLSKNIIRNLIEALKLFCVGNALSRRLKIPHHSFYFPVFVCLPLLSVFKWGIKRIRSRLDFLYYRWIFLFGTSRLSLCSHCPVQGLPLVKISCLSRILCANRWSMEFQVWIARYSTECSRNVF